MRAPWGPRAAVLAVLLASSSPARAHVGEPTTTSLAQEPLVQAASLLAVVAILLGGLGYLAWCARRRQGPDGTWTLAVLGMGWGVLAVTVPRGALARPPMTWVGWALVLGSLGLAGGIGWDRARVVVGRLRRGRRAAWTSVAVAALFLPLHALAHRLVVVPDAWDAATAGALPYVRAFEDVGPLTVWPGLAWWHPTLGLGGHVTPALLGSLLVQGGLLVLGAGLVAAAREEVAGARGPRLRLAAACLAVPLVLDLAIVLLGFAPTSRLLALADPRVGLHSALLVSRLWLLVAGVALAAAALDGSGSAPDRARGPSHL